MVKEYFDLNSKSVQHLSIIKIDDEYGTPKDAFAKACEEFNLKIDKDICASEANHVCNDYITKEQNCFDCGGISENFYMNPPYSEIKKFMKFAYEQHIKYNVDVLILTYAKTDTKFWHEYVEGKAEVHFIKGRLNFFDEKGNVKKIYDKKAGKWRKGASPYPSVWIIYRKKNDALENLEQAET